MSTGTILVFLAAALVAPDTPKGEPLGVDKAKLQGSWYMTDYKSDGPVTFVGVVPGPNPDLVIEGDKYSAYGHPMGHYKIDVVKGQKQIDFLSEKGFEKEVLGIYKLEGETLTICDSQTSGVRPTDFTVAKGSKRRLSVYKRSPPQ